MLKVGNPFKNKQIASLIAPWRNKIIFLFVRDLLACVEQQIGTTPAQHKQSPSFVLAWKQLSFSDDLMKNKNISNISWRHSSSVRKPNITLFSQSSSFTGTGDSTLLESKLLKACCAIYPSIFERVIFEAISVHQKFKSYINIIHTFNISGTIKRQHGTKWQHIIWND